MSLNYLLALSGSVFLFNAGFLKTIMLQTNISNGHHNGHIDSCVQLHETRALFFLFIFRSTKETLLDLKAIGQLVRRADSKYTKSPPFINPSHNKQTLVSFPILSHYIFRPLIDQHKGVCLISEFWYFFKKPSLGVQSW